MKSVGEVMAIGRIPRGPPEGLPIPGDGPRRARQPRGRPGPGDAWGRPEALLAACARPRAERLEAVERALRLGGTVDEVAAASDIDPWFVDGIARIVEVGAEARRRRVHRRPRPGLLWRAKRHGFSDPQLAAAVGATEGEVRTRRRALGVEPVYRSVDTCAGEFEASTPYHYSTYEEETEVPATGRRRVVVLGSGPNRIGQGVEFDTACVHAVQALREAGYETVMVNCNPETVSTDYDIADRLYVEPLTCEDVLEVCRAEAAGGDLVGVIVTMGGQTPLQLAHGLAAAGVPLLGTRPTPSTWPRTGAGSGRSWSSAASTPRPGARRPPSSRPWPSPSGSATRSWSAPPMCSAAAPWRSATTPTAWAAPAPWPASAGQGPTAGRGGLPGSPRRPAGAGRPVPGGRGRGRRRRPLRRHRAGAGLRGDGAHRGGRHPLRRLGLRAPADHPRGRPGRGRRGHRPASAAPSG